MNKFNLSSSIRVLEEHPIELFHRYCAKRPSQIPRNLILFREKGIVCARCGVEANKVIKVKHADGGKAWMLVTDDDFMTRDHITPRSLGGSNQLVNLQPMCNTCNGIKHNCIDDCPKELQELMEIINQLKILQTTLHNEHVRVTLQVDKAIAYAKELAIKFVGVKQ